MNRNRSRRISLRRTCLLAAVAAGLAAPAAVAQQIPTSDRPFPAGKTPAPLELPPLPAKKPSTKRFGDWTQRCDVRPGATEHKCFLTQTVVHTQNGRKQPILAITIGRFGPKRQPGMVLLVPLAVGLYLPAGLKLSVPGTEPLPIAVQSCLPAGCSATFPLTPALTAAMKKADAGSLEIRTIRKQAIPVPLSFKGFTAAMDSLGGD